MNDELMLLGEILLQNESYLESKFDIKKNYFLNPWNGLIFEAMTELHQSTGSIYHENLKRVLSDKSEEVANYYVDNVMVPEEALGFDFYAERLINRYRFSKIQTLGQKWGKKDFSQENIEELMGEFSSDLLALDEADFENDLMSASENNEKTLENMSRDRSDEKRYFSFGIPELDRILGGIFPEDTITIGARTGVGKTILGVQIATEVMKQGGKVSLSSMEMGPEEYNHRMISLMSSVDSEKMRKPELLNNAEIDRMMEAMEISNNFQYRINKNQALTFSKVRKQALKTKRQLNGLDLVVIDHLHILEEEGGSESYRHHIKACTIGAKRLGQSLKCNVIVLAQCSRGPEKENRPPNLGDLKESGSIEEDSNIVVLIHRDEEFPNEAVLLIKKNRNGPSPASIKLNFVGEYVRFESHDS